MNLLANVVDAKQCMPQSSNFIPDGEYLGFWNGYEVSVIVGTTRWILKTDLGLRGLFGVGCKVTAKKGKVTVRQLEPEKTAADVLRQITESAALPLPACCGSGDDD